MKCAQCQSESGIEMVAQLWTDWDDPRDKTYDQWHLCRRCGATYYSVLTDEFYGDDFRLETYEADPQAWRQSYERARKCPRPDDYECKCPAHTQGREGRGKLVSDQWVHYSDDND